MVTATQYRAKAAQFHELLRTTQSPGETTRLRALEQSYSSLADNLDWLKANGSKTVAPAPADAASRTRREHDEAHDEQENVLRCLGAAVILTWNTIPQDQQRALFQAASSVRDSERTAPMKEVLARFLHDHKDDALKPIAG